MDLHSVRFALLKISVLVLCGSSWVFSGFIFESRPDEHEASAGAEDPLQQLVRLPASLPAQLPQNIPGVFGPQAKPPEPVKMDVVKLPCWDRHDRSEQSVNARWVRLVGKACQNNFSPEMVTVRNLANGYMGTVFAAGNAGLTTDFIPLENGKNDLLIRFESEPGVSLETQVTFTR